MGTMYVAALLTLSYILMTSTSRSASAVPECSQSRYLPYLDARYKNDHIVSVMDGQRVTISCTIICPSSREDLNTCSDNIHQDWMIIDPSEDKIFKINAATDRNEFLRTYEIEETVIQFSNSNRLDFEQCSWNETRNFRFSLTLHNFTSSLEGLMVICGLRRHGHNHTYSDYHLVGEYARLRTIPTVTTTIPATTAATTEATASPTVSTISTTPATATFAPIVVLGESSWPDEASFPVVALLSAVCIFFILLIAVLITYNIKLQRQLRDSVKTSNGHKRHSSNTPINGYCHYDAFPKHLWQTAVFPDNGNNTNTNNADLW